MPYQLIYHVHPSVRHITHSCLVYRPPTLINLPFAPWHVHINRFPPVLSFCPVLILLSIHPYHHSIDPSPSWPSYHPISHIAVTDNCSCFWIFVFMSSVNSHFTYVCPRCNWSYNMVASASTMHDMMQRMAYATGQEKNQTKETSLHVLFTLRCGCRSADLDGYAMYIGYMGWPNLV